jgi:hypothetical protein
VNASTMAVCMATALDVASKGDKRTDPGAPSAVVESCANSPSRYSSAGAVQRARRYRTAITLHRCDVWVSTGVSDGNRRLPTVCGLIRQLMIMRQCTARVGGTAKW